MCNNGWSTTWRRPTGDNLRSKWGSNLLSNNLSSRGCKMRILKRRASTNKEIFLLQRLNTNNSTLSTNTTYQTHKFALDCIDEEVPLTFYSTSSSSSKNRTTPILPHRLPVQLVTQYQMKWTQRMTFKTFSSHHLWKSLSKSRTLDPPPRGTAFIGCPTPSPHLLTTNSPFRTTTILPQKLLSNTIILPFSRIVILLFALLRVILSTH
mmetsp:Transcript_758/g.2530  ORF Transcript_758/g.2530 Transcript_758/m.2530 type:complete len:208 (+) Transcript_758:826-1449(+)